MQALERQNGELRDAASKKDAVLAESRCVVVWWGQWWVHMPAHATEHPTVPAAPASPKQHQPHRHAFPWMVPPPPPPLTLLCRKFIESYLQRSATATEQRQETVRGAAPAAAAAGPASNGSVKPPNGAYRPPNGAVQPQPGAGRG